VIPELEAVLEAAKSQEERGMLEASRVLAHRVLASPQVTEFDKYWRRAAEQINAVNRKLMNSTAPVSEKKGYRVVRGDSLQRIASRFHTTVGSMLRINPDLRRDDGRDPIIRPSQTILYISGKWSIKVSKQHYLLILYFNDQLYRVYTVGIGKDNRTPVGNFLITSTLAEPAWTPPGKNIPYGDPENVLGTRWLKLTPDAGTDPTLEGYGIHGTWEPESVGSGCSAGCVRMRNEEVEELFDYIPVPGASTPPVKVIIQE
jgi:lipoprotein-anchoring transpeptidase ErfK/SrfK